MNWGEHLKSEWQHIRKAPLAFAGAVLTAGVAIWVAIDWVYRARLDSAHSLNRDYEARLNGWSPAEAQKQLAELQEQVRRLGVTYSPPLTSEQSAKLRARLTDLPPRKVTITYDGPESYNLGKSLDDAFKSAGWPMPSSFEQALGGGAGLRMYITDDTDLPLVEALREQLGDSLQLQPQRVPKEDGISIYVGFRAPIEN